MLEGCRQCCVTFVYHPCRIDIHITTGPALHGNGRVTKLPVISGHASQVFHSDFFPRLVKYDVTPQPVNA